MRIADEIIQVIGFVLIALAAYFIWPPLGILTAGVLTVVVGALFDPRIARRKD